LVSRDDPCLQHHHLNHPDQAPRIKLLQNPVRKRRANRLKPPTLKTRQRLTHLPFEVKAPRKYHSVDVAASESPTATTKTTRRKTATATATSGADGVAAPEDEAGTAEGLEDLDHRPLPLGHLGPDTATQGQETYLKAVHPSEVALGDVDGVLAAEAVLTIITTMAATGTTHHHHHHVVASI